MGNKNKRMTYKEAGVDINAGNRAVERIKKAVSSTFTPNVLTGIGYFGAMFQVPVQEYKTPVLVSSVDGVGTKLKIAFMVNRHDTVGEDLVNHCVNDISTSGAIPLYFMDYIATGKVLPEVIESIVAGMTRGCIQSGCSLIGGEIAEMADFYKPGEYDIAGTIVGIVEKENIIDGSKIGDGDILIGLKSNGLHTNGYTLVRKVLFEQNKKKPDQYEPELGGIWAEELLRVHRNYLPLLKGILKHPGVHGISHITGGGIEGNTRRILPPECGLEINWDAWERPVVFQIIQRLGNVPEEDMRRTFNLGIGLILAVSREKVDYFLSLLEEKGEKGILVGEITKQKELN